MNDYPTDEQLDRITKWTFDAPDSFTQFMAYVKSVGNYWPSEMFGWTETPETRTYHVSTGGWSGNESILSAMQDNLTFWMVCWQQHQRGGHYIFMLPDPAQYFTRKG
mgnify:CR=1 FL=1